MGSIWHQIALIQPELRRFRTGITVGILGLLGFGTFTAYGGWQLVWGDKFNGTSIDPNHWTFETGNRRGWGNCELEYYTL
ncbi:MAG: hypothetical protein WBS33_19155 [Verrucomicrobiia bacterium]